MLDHLLAGLADHYRLERILGRGGMATVYLAYDLKHDRKVALKVLRPELADAVGPERFQREIRLAARLQHPHILSVYDSGESGGSLWFTMPYVDGESLRARLHREKQLPLQEALRIASDAAGALEYAHRQGIIHRDIKPENLLLTISGDTLVADFGIARALDSADDQTLTETGIVIGTPAYMSPEQAAGERQLDARSDIYSLAAVLYEMLAGEVPFTGPTAQAIQMRRLTETPRSLRTLRDRMPEPVDSAIGKALSRTPADRFASMHEFSSALTAGTPVSSSGPAIASPMPARGRRVAISVAAIGLVLLLGLGVLFDWFRTSRSGRDPGNGSVPSRLAVLPFENLGDSADGYLADGVTDAVRDKLAGMHSLEVIASTSSNAYRRTTKLPERIGRELNARYLLIGKVRWARGSDGSRRIEVRPELVDAATGAERWGQPFDAALTDVFLVQRDIAGRVAEALGIVLGSTERSRLAQRPTENLAAYDAFLRGEELGHGLPTLDQTALRQAREYYERAVALDSTFALAWAQLSRAYSWIYWNAPNRVDPEMVRRAAERALALAPARGEGHLALGDYYSLVLKDYRRGLDEYTRGQQLAPTDARLLSSAGYAALNLSQGDRALKYLQRAQELDPRSVDVQWRVGWALLNLRRYAEGLRELDRGLALNPANLDLIGTKVMTLIAQGDLAGTRAVLRAVPPEVDPSALAAYVGTYGSLSWALDEDHQQILMRLPPSAFDNDSATWGLVEAEIRAHRGDSVSARAYADSALAAAEAQLRAAPEDAGIRANFGLTLAFAGRMSQAIREGKQAVEMIPTSRDALSGSWAKHQLALIYLLAGERKKAIDELEPLLDLPYWLSPPWLRIDPNFRSLKGNPRFERLANRS